MASKIRILRSTGATAPGSLEYGELAITVEQGTAGTSANKAGRLFIGNASGNPVELGGEYTYKLMDHPLGQLENGSAALVDSSGQIDGWSVAGILTATRTDVTDLVTTNLNVTGVSTFAGSFGLNGDVTIGDAASDTLTVEATAGFNTSVTINDNLNVTGVATVGILTVTGTANIDGDLFVQGARVGAGEFVNLRVLGITTLGDNVADLVDVQGRTTFATDATFSTNLIVTGVSTHTGNSTFAGTIDVDGQAIFDDVTVSAGSTFEGIVDINNNATVSGTLDVDGQAIFDDVTVSAAATFTGAVDMNGGLDVSGGETVLSSATVSDLTDNRVVIAGASGVLEDDANFTFDGTTLNVGATVDATIVDAATLRAPVGVVTALTSTDIVGTAGTFTSALTMGSGGTKYTLTNTDGAANQVLTTNGSGSVTFQEISSTLVISAGAAATDPIDLRTETFTIAATNNETKTTLTNNQIQVGLATDVIVGGGLTVTNNLLVLGNLTVEGTETIINVEFLDVQDKHIGVASTSTASNTTANGGGFFVHGGSDGDKTIFWSLGQSGFEVNQDWLPNADGSFDLGNTNREWQNLFVDGLAELDDVNVSAAATINTLNVTGTGTIATADINGGNIDGTVIGAASSAAGTFTTVNATSITANAGTLDAGDVTFTNLRVTGVSTLASLLLSTGTNTNGAAYFDANGQLQSTATPSAGIQTSNFILTTNASGVPSWTDTIDCGTF